MPAASPSVAPPAVAQRGPRRARYPSALRLVVVLAGTALVAAALTAAARALAPATSGLALAASIAAGATGMLLVCSIVEWLVHGHLMHRRSRLPLLRLAYDLHHRAHHWLHFPPDRYLQDEVSYVPLVPPRPERACRTRLETVCAAGGQAAFYAAFALPILAAGWALTGNAPFVLAATAVSALVVLLAVHIHSAVHCPGHSPLERFGWFWALDRHHYVHHIDTRANVNFLLPLGDLLLGTLRTELAPEERARWPSYEDARRNVLPSCRRADAA